MGSSRPFAIYPDGVELPGKIVVGSREDAELRAHSMIGDSEARSLPGFLPVIGGRHQIALIEDISRWTRIILRPFDPYRRNAKRRRERSLDRPNIDDAADANECFVADLHCFGLTICLRGLTAVRVSNFA